mmetsp:Transcript_46157/g.142275  ORF Transcript_46157/g.142275 Transcript_46157/m.142275 type:complete len:206 (-) Transcript_46157:241-858(-)
MNERVGDKRLGVYVIRFGGGKHVVANPEPAEVEGDTQGAPWRREGEAQSEHEDHGDDEARGPEADNVDAEVLAVLRRNVSYCAVRSGRRWRCVVRRQHVAASQRTARWHEQHDRKRGDEGDTDHGNAHECRQRPAWRHRKERNPIGHCRDAATEQGGYSTNCKDVERFEAERDQSELGNAVGDEKHHHGGEDGGITVEEAAELHI